MRNFLIFTFEKLNSFLKRSGGTRKTCPRAPSRCCLNRSLPRIEGGRKTGSIRPGRRNRKCKDRKMKINTAQAFGCSRRCRKRLERKIRKILRVLDDIYLKAMCKREHLDVCPEDYLLSPYYVLGILLARFLFCVYLSPLIGKATLGSRYSHFPNEETQT